MREYALASNSAPGNETDELPHWDLTPLFPGLAAPEFAAGFTDLFRAIDGLAVLFEELDIRERPAGEWRSASVVDFERALLALNDIEQRFESMSSYLYGHMTTDSRNELAQARYSQLQERTVLLSTLEVRFNAWIGTQDIDRLIAQSSMAAAHEYPLRQLH